MKSQVIGTTMPVLEFLLEPNDAIISEAGELSWMSPNVQMTTHTQFAGGGGFFGAFKRVVGGGSLFMTEYRAMGGNGELAFATRVPGHIVPVEVAPGYDYMVHRHGFLCATSAIQIGVGFQQSLGAGIFGGDGFLLQKISGQGTAWLELSGEVVTRDLQQGETLLVHPGHVGAFRPACRFRSPWCAGSRTSSSAATVCSSRCSPAQAASGSRPCPSRASPTRSRNTCRGSRRARPPKLESWGALWGRCLTI